MRQRDKERGRAREGQRQEKRWSRETVKEVQRRKETKAEK